MSRRIGVAVACCIVCLTAPSSLAHHSFSAGFDLSKKFNVTGTLTRMDWRNPHIELFLNAKGEQGQMEAWMIESMPPSFFRNRTVGKADFENAVGKTLTIQGVRARDGSLSGIAEKVTFPDGKSVTVLELQPPAQSSEEARP